MAPVTLGLRMLFGVAVDLAGRGEQDARAHPLGESEHVDRAHHAGLDRLDGVELVMDRRSGAGQMEDAIDFEQDRLDGVVADDLEVGIAFEMNDVGATPAEEVIEAYYLVAVVEQPLAEVRAEKSRAACDQCPHRISPRLAGVLPYHAEHGFDHVVHVAFLHRGEDRQRDASAVHLLRDREITRSVAIPALVEIHRMERDAMDRAADAALAQKLDELSASDSQQIQL